MYHTEAGSHTWTFVPPEAPDATPNKRRDRGSTRKTATGVGVYVIDHVSTGRFIVVSSKNVSLDVDKELKAMIRGKHPVKMLQRQFDWEPTIRCIEYPANSYAAAKKIEAEIRATNDCNYCLLN